MMDAVRVAEVLEEIASLLELKGEEVFKVRAYRNAARVIETLPEELAVVCREGRLAGVKGIGKALAEKIGELVATGSMRYHAELRGEFPESLLELFALQGLGPKKIKVLYEELAVDSIAKLEAVCREGRVAGLKGFGEKTQANLLLSIEQHRSYASQHRYGSVIGMALALVETLREHPAVSRVSLAGSLRRGKEVIKDIDLIASSSKPEEVMAAFVAWTAVERVLNHGPTKSSVLLQGGVQCDLRVVPDAIFPYALAHFTGSKEHNVALRQRAIDRGMKLSEWGLFKGTGEREELVPCRTEEELHRALDLDYIEPELRENLGEVAAAEAGELPKLVEWQQLRGTFHNHTTASDGKNTLREMVEAACELGLEYIGISDHSKSSFQANGLDERRLEEQGREVEALRREFAGEIEILWGVECDILKEGRLDFADEVLAQLDYVVASLHVASQSDEAANTQRLCAAMRNRYVTMLGHPTGRLLLAREAYPVALGEVLACAAETGTWIELNSNPYRLDLDWRWWRRAREMGVRCVITPDAHRVEDYGFLRIGANIARKGWLRAEDVVNTLPWERMRRELRAKRGR